MEIGCVEQDIHQYRCFACQSIWRINMSQYSRDCVLRMDLEKMNIANRKSEFEDWY